MSERWISAAQKCFFCMNQSLPIGRYIPDCVYIEISGPDEEDSGYFSSFLTVVTVTPLLVMSLHSWVTMVTHGPAVRGQRLGHVTDSSSLVLLGSMRQTLLYFLFLCDVIMLQPRPLNAFILISDLLVFIPPDILQFTQFSFCSLKSNGNSLLCF